VKHRSKPVLRDVRAAVAAGTALRTAVALMLTAGALLLGGAIATAHPLAPALLELREVAAGRVEVLWKTSALRLPGSDVRPVLPPHCRSSEPARSEASASSVTSRWALDCGVQGLVGARVGVDDLPAARISALLRVELSDGRTFQRVLRADAPFTTIPERESAWAVLRSYAALGVEHILTGLDHLLFVFGLLLLVGRGRRLVATVTAFTIGHSLTLSLAALEVVTLPTGPIELAIAGSIFVLAVELARGSEAPRSRLRRWPWVMAFAFGLLHGMGFAGALAEVGLPQVDIPLALFSFNVGIELGQIAFVLAVLLVERPLRQPLGRLPLWAEQIPVYVLGSLAAFWCLERAAALLS